MAVLRKHFLRKGFVYYVDLTFEGRRRRISTMTSDITLARRILDDIKGKIAHGKFRLKDLTPNNITLVKLHEEYLDTYAKLHKAPGSLEIDRQAMDDLIERCGANTTARSINETKVNALIAWWKNEKVFRSERVDEDGKIISPAKVGLSATTINIKIRTLRAIFNWALREENEYIARNPFAKVKPLRSEVKQTLTMSVEEIKAVLAETAKHGRTGEELRRVILFNLMTAGRRGEDVNIKWKDIDFSQRVLTFIKTKGKKARNIPINDELLKLLEEIKAEVPNASPDDFVFRISDDNASRKFKEYLTILKLRPELHFHCLRHTAANNMVSQNIHIKVIQDILGHSDIQTSMHYLKTLPDALRPAMDVLSIKKYLGPDETPSGL